MKLFKWLYPGLKIKRWLVLSFFGMVGMGFGSAKIILQSASFEKFIGSSMLLGGAVIALVGIRQMIRSLVGVFLPQKEEELVDIVFQKRHLRKGSKIVTIGGGTGLSVLLHGLKEHTSNITAVVTVADDGGSSGRLRAQLDVLPPGDIRNCLVALADAEPLMRELFQYRFDEGSELHGHNFGNLFITALSKVTGDFELAIKESSKILAIRGRVVPSTLNKIALMAEHKDGTSTLGESRIPKASSPITRLRLKPEVSQPTQEALDAIADADAIVMGPGSLFTSVIPNLLVKGLPDAILSSKALKIYVCNVMTQHGETDGYNAYDHLEALTAHSYKEIVDTCIVNTAKVPDFMLTKYAAEGGYPVTPEISRIKEEGYDVVASDVISTINYVRHDSQRLAQIIMELVNDHRLRKSVSS